MRRQAGSAHVIIVTVLTVALVATLGFVFWQNFMNSSTTSQASVTDNDTRKKMTSQENATDSTPINDIREDDTSRPLISGQPVPSQGQLSGSLTHPSEGIPSDMTVYAVNLQTKEVFSTKDHIKNSKYHYGVGYLMAIPVGTYEVYATLASDPNRRAYHTESMVCTTSRAHTCPDAQKKRIVTVETAKTTEDIMVGDWWNHTE